MIRLHYIAKGRPQVLRCEPHEVAAAVELLSIAGIKPRMSGMLPPKACEGRIFAQVGPSHPGEARCGRRRKAKEEGMEKTFHMCLDVRGALKNWKKKQFVGLFKIDGRPSTAGESIDMLHGELLKGHVVIPFGKCDNFDYSGGGCQGHADENQEASNA